MKRIGLVLLISVFCFLSSVFCLFVYAQQQETLTLITYYPAPYGGYNTLQAGQTGHLLTLDYNTATTRHRIFSNNTDILVLSHDGTANDLVVETDGDIGIGTANPIANLTINQETDVPDDAKLDNYGLIIANPQDDTGEEVGLGFRISTNLTGERPPGAAITHERTGTSSAGKLHFKTSDDTNNLDTRMTIDEDGTTFIKVDNPSSLTDLTPTLIVEGHPANYGQKGSAIYAFNNATLTWQAAVRGVNNNGTSGTGVFGRGKSYGVMGVGNSAASETVSGTFPASAGVYGYSDHTNGTGVLGRHYPTNQGWAGYFQGICYATTRTGGFIDIAEYIPSPLPLEPGDVVTINPNDSPSVTLSSKAYDTTVAGIISTEPGYLLGVEPDKGNDGEVKLTLTGRTPCKVSTENGSINPGDLLTTSSTPGYAMKAKPIGEINGYPIYPQGCIIGKALEPLEEGKGKILVLVCLM